MEDRDGNVWVGTSGGLVRMQRRRSRDRTVMTERDGLASDWVLALYEDREGSVWVGTQGGGLNRFADGTFTTWATREGLSSNMPYGLYQDRKGDVWIGTEAGGLNRFSNGTFTHFGAARGLPHHAVWTIVEDARGMLWVGTDGGLARLDGDRFVTLREPTACRAIACGRCTKDATARCGSAPTAASTRCATASWSRRSGRGRARWPPACARFTRRATATLWIGTNTGLVRRSPDGRERIVHQQGWPAERSRAVDRRDRGRRALGELPQRRPGAHRRRPADSDHRAAGLSTTRCCTWSTDGYGHLWMTSTRGIFHVAMAELEAVARGTRQTMHAAAVRDARRPAQRAGHRRLAARRDPHERRPPVVRDDQGRGHGRSARWCVRARRRRW